MKEEILSFEELEKYLPKQYKDIYQYVGYNIDSLSNKYPHKSPFEIMELESKNHYNYPFKAYKATYTNFMN